MLRSNSKILVQQTKQEQGGPDNNTVGLNVKVPWFVLFFSRSRSEGGRQYRYAGDEEILAPISQIVEINSKKSEANGKSAAPPPLPYRLTFKNRKSTTNPWSKHKTVTYVLGFNSVNVTVTVEVFTSGLRRVFVNGEEVTRQKVPCGEWQYSHFFTDQNSYNPSHKSLGTTLKLVVQEDQTVALFADGFPVERLRRSSEVVKGSPSPPNMMTQNNGENIDILNISNVSRLATT